MPYLDITAYIEKINVNVLLKLLRSTYQFESLGYTQQKSSSKSRKGIYLG